jgi:methionine-rich copper-binding protein CopC
VSGPAGAALVTHAQLLATTPADGDTVETVAEVTLTFSEDVNEQFVQVRVDGPGGDEADGDPAVDGQDVTQALSPDLAAGEHRVTYRVVSVDGHPVSGTFSFTTTEGPGPASPTDSPTTAAPSDTPSATASAPSPSGSTSTSE